MESRNTETAASMRNGKPGESVNLMGMVSFRSSGHIPEAGHMYPWVADRQNS